MMDFEQLYERELAEFPYEVVFEGEPHFRYERTDCGTVCRDHSNCGTVLKSHWIGCGQYSDQALRPHKTALAVIKKLDKLYPIETN